MLFAARSADLPSKMAGSMTPADRAVLALGHELKTQGYRFVTITPASHARVNARAVNATGRSLRDIFGWSRPFRSSDLPAPLLALLKEADAVVASGDHIRSAVRFSSIGDQLFAHSSFPTNEADSVFFGPDTYRFVQTMRSQLRAEDIRGRRVVDIGAGSGAGGLALVQHFGDTHSELVLCDLSPKALRFSRINAALNGTPNVTALESDLLASIAGQADIIVANPPYLVDPAARLYRNGGGDLGFELSLRIVRESIRRLNKGGKLVLYTGAPVIDGVDQFKAAVTPLLRRGVSFIYEETDPDVFGEELDGASYCAVDRIAVVTLALEVH